MHQTSDGRVLELLRWQQPRATSGSAGEPHGSWGSWISTDLCIPFGYIIFIWTLRNPVRGGLTCWGAVALGHCRGASNAFDTSSPCLLAEQTRMIRCADRRITMRHYLRELCSTVVVVVPLHSLIPEPTSSSFSFSFFSICSTAVRNAKSPGNYTYRMFWCPFNSILSDALLICSNHEGEGLREQK